MPYTPLSEIERRKALGQALMDQPMRRSGYNKTHPLEGIAHLIRQWGAGKAMGAASEQESANEKLLSQEMEMMSRQVRGEPAFSGMQVGQSPSYSHPDVQKLAIQNALNQAAGVKQHERAKELAQMKQGEPKRYNIGPGGALADSMGQVLYQAPFKPEKPTQRDPTKDYVDASGNVVIEGTPKPGGDLSPGEQAIDKAFAKEYVDWNARGGYADVQKQMAQLGEAKANLEDPDKNLTGGYIGVAPDIVLAGMNPDALSNREAVEEVVQRNLRLILGAQFTEKEGVRLIARAYNDKLDEAENAKRVGRLMEQIDAAAKAKESASLYFAEKGTLKGWDGRMPSLSDFRDMDFSGDLPGGVTEDDIKETMRIHNLTREEVLSRLNGG